MEAAGVRFQLRIDTKLVILSISQLDRPCRIENGHGDNPKSHLVDPDIRPRAVMAFVCPAGWSEQANADCRPGNAHRHPFPGDIGYRRPLVNTVPG
jgi:hypothetical protein